jgi:hypothetical protein
MQRDTAVFTPREDGSLNRPWIYQHVRNLKGVVRSMTDPTSQNSTIPTVIGNTLKDYLLSHGYEATAVMEILAASVASLTVIDFMGHLCPKGLPIKEAEYMWGLIARS